MMSQDEMDITLIELNIKAAQTALKDAEQRLAKLKARLDTAKTVNKPVASMPEIMPKATAPKLEVLKKPALEPVKVDEPLTINDEWQKVIDLLNNGTEHVFITGGAGTGKSTLLQHYLGQAGEMCVVVAPTGVAALRVGGETIHRFFGFGAHALEDDDIRVVSDSRRAKYKTLDTIIIDEISMVRADLMDAIDKFMRLNGRNKDKPFGGCRVIMFGDLYQLPPVAKEKDEKKWLTETYGTDMPFFFHAMVWRDTSLKTCELTTIFRQKDQKFTDALNAIRKGSMTPEHLALINSRVQYGFKPPDGDLWLTLTTTNNAADQANQRMLASIQSPAREFYAVIQGDFDLKNAPTDDVLQLKAGAIVMFIRNDADHRWVNGTLGKVTSIDPLWVQVNGKERAVEAETWEQIQYTFDEKTRKLTKDVRGKFTQIPLKLASAITIHKAQGLSLDHVILDLANGAFAAGQAYVALSRCRTLEGTVLRRPLQERDLIISTEVQRFMRGEAIARPEPKGQMALIT